MVGRAKVGHTTSASRELSREQIIAHHNRTLSILVRKLLRRGNFTSSNDLRNHVLDFIAYFNRTMARPFKRTYLEKPLHA